jgi:cell division protease FtsH
VFLGRDFAAHPDYSDQVAFEIDSEVRRLIDEAHDEALDVLQGNRKELDAIALALIERETIEKEELVQLLDGITKRLPRDGKTEGAGIAVARRSVRTPKGKDGSLR